MTTSPVVYDCHMHTTLCKHATGEPEEYAATALARGLKGIVFTCHCPLPNQISHQVRMREDEMSTYIDMIRRTRETYAGKLDVGTGLECDWLPELADYLREMLFNANLDHVLGSVHYFLPEYRLHNDTAGFYTFQKNYFRSQAQAAESGLFDTLAHPDLIKNEAPDKWDFDAIRDEVADSLDRIKACDVAMELNTSGMLKPYSEFNPGRPMLEMIHEREIPIVLGSDSHSADRPGEQFVVALEMLRDIGFSHIHHYWRRKRQSVAISDALATVKVAADCSADQDQQSH